MESLIGRFLSDKNANELETKFMFKDNRGELASNVPRRLYFTFLNTLKEQLPSNESSLQTGTNTSFSGIPITNHKFLISNVDIYRDFRVITESTGDRRIEKKKRILDFTDRNFNIKYSVSEETALSDLTRLDPKDLIMTRSRKRDSFRIPNGVIDLTEVSTVNKGRMFISYEIEIEFIGPKEVTLIETFLNQVYVIYMMFLGTKNIYTVKMKDEINAFIQASKISLVQARNIKYKDIKDGAIIGNPKWSMYVTYKADGKRFLLVIHPTGVWLIFPPYQFNLIIPLDNPDSIKVFDGFFGSIFDGELVKSETFDIRYFIFDCLFSYGTDVRKKEYSERMKTSGELTRAVPENKYVSLEIKETRHLTNPENFTLVMTELLTKRQDLDYQEDGLIFIPSSEYNPESDKIPYHKRILSDYPDVLKYKDPKFLTIDFAIFRSSGGNGRDMNGRDVSDRNMTGRDMNVNGTGKILLQSYNDKFGKNVFFKGSDKHPFDQDKVINNELTNNLPSGSIVEYSYIEGYFWPVRVRSDKSGPNNIFVAEAVWEDIINPLTIDDMIGNTLKFAYMDFNAIKMGLWGYLRARNVKTVLENGIGALGDGGKMFGIDKIIGIEPNVKNMTEALTRIGTYKLDGKVKIVNTGAEDPRIPDFVFNELNGQVDAVSMMLSLSFFWQSPELLNSLVKNISRVLKPGGIFTFMTIDGYNLSLAFNNYGNVLNYGEATYINRDTHIEVVMPGTIVERQDESLVRIDDLKMRLESEDIFLVEYHNADLEKVRSKNTKEFEWLYTWGYFIKSDKSTKGMVRSGMDTTGLKVYTKPNDLLVDVNRNLVDMRDMNIVDVSRGADQRQSNMNQESFNTSPRTRTSARTSAGRKSLRTSAGAQPPPQGIPIPAYQRPNIPTVGKFILPSPSKTTTFGNFTM